MILGEMKRRNGGGDFLDPIFTKQNELITDTSRFQAWNCTRRGAKSTSFAKRALTKLLATPGSKGLYLALTLDSAKEILWDVVCKELDDRMIPYRGYENQGIFLFKNKSQLRFFGVDGSYKEMKKILGQKQKIVGIDEAGSMTIDMPQLCYQMIQPALSDLQGDLIILGTCENIPNTFLERIITGKDEFHAMWKKHIWTTAVNPYMAEIYAAEMARILAVNPKAKDASWFKTHYLNQWCADDDLLIIKNDKTINEVERLPDVELTYGLGVDLGFNDATSFTVAAFSRHDPYLYIAKSFKLSGMDLTDVSNQIKKLNAQYNFFKVKIDGANKQGVQEMQNRHDIGVTLESADKTDKATFLRLMSDDYKQGKVKHVAGECDPLDDEQSALMWIKGSSEEDPRCQNHCNDGALYIWRECRTYLFQPESTPWTTTDQKMEDQFKQEAEQILLEQEDERLLY